MKIREFSPSDADACFKIRAEAFTTLFADELGGDGVKPGLSAYAPADLIRMPRRHRDLLVFGPPAPDEIV